MSLIIAIEPDRDQAAQLKDLVRRHTKAELILADTTAHAIDVMGERVPDLVLIPAFLSPEDDEALTTALRVTEAAAHVQTLTIPVLGEPQQKSAAQGVLSRLRWDQPRPSSPDSCDPKLFAEQITEYLQRVAKERGPMGSNGKGSHGSNGAGREAAPATQKAPATPAADKPKAAAPAKAVFALPAAQKEVASLPAAAKEVAAPQPAPSEAATTPQPESELDVSALEAALAVVLDPPGVAEPAVAFDAGNKVPDSLLAPEELEGLEAGLSSLMERLANEESTVSADATPPVNVEAADWAELKQLESVEYAIPKKIIPIDDALPAPKAAPLDPPPSQPPAAQPAAAPVEEAAAAPASAASAQEPAPPPEAAEQPQPAARTPTSDWGDLMESLKKDLGN